MSDDEDVLYKLFDVVRYYTIQAGGDGDGWVVSDEYKKLAGMFEAYEASLPDKWFLERHEGEGEIWFMHEQECICFSLSSRAGLTDITVIL